MQVRESMLVHRPVGEVFEFIADPASAPRWRSYVIASTGTASAVGDRVQQTYDYEGKVVRTDLEVTEYRPPERLAFKVDSPVRGHIVFSCRPDEGGTRVSVTLSGNVPGPAALFAGRIEKEAANLLKGDLAKLKAALEPPR